ncbi:EF hand domain [Trypanosoma vivax]|nr:hypothetical protein TRVL_00849 [Trypanosoma vivax]KAH8613727.1 EF hand domain [Trypanosoma vivax]
MVLVFGAASGTLVCGSISALCYSIDTPEYLIPYYLRDFSSRFNHYASHRSSKDGFMYMTLEDFVRALLVLKRSKSLTPSSVERLRRLFVDLDSDGDAYLNLTEFSFLMVLLTAKLEDIKMLFSILDSNKEGTLSLDQFAGVLRGLGCTPIEAKTFSHKSKNGIVRRLFGERGERRCSFNDMAETIRTINEEVWAVEFSQFDTDGNGRISAEDFGKLIANQMIGSNVPFYIVDNIRKMRGGGSAITLDLWLGFHRIMQHVDDISEALHLFSASNLPLGKAEINRALKAVGVQPLTGQELDLILALFDRDGNGAVDFDEFIGVMKHKSTYQHCRIIDNKSPVRRPFPSRFFECVWEATLRN